MKEQDKIKDEISQVDASLRKLLNLINIITENPNFNESRDCYLIISLQNYLKETVNYDMTEVGLVRIQKIFKSLTVSKFNVQASIKF